MEGFDICNFFTSTSEFDWFSSDVTNRKGRTTTSITVNLCKDDTSHFQLSVKFTRNVCCFLTDHGIDDQENLIWLSKCFNVTELIHEKFVNLQTTCRIDQNIVVMVSFCLLQTLANNLHCRNFSPKSKDRNINLLSQCFELVDGRRTIDVGCNHQGTSILFLFKFVSKFTCKSCFTSPLQTDHHDNGWDFW